MTTRRALKASGTTLVGAMATMHKNRDGGLKRVDCELRIKKEEQ